MYFEFSSNHLIIRVENIIFLCRHLWTIKIKFSNANPVAKQINVGRI